MTSQTENRWARTGKVLTTLGIAVGIIWTSIQIYGHLNPQGADVVATGEYSLFDLPDSLKPKFQRVVEQSYSIEGIKKILPESKNLSDEDRTRIAIAVGSYIKDRFLGFTTDELYDFKSFWAFEIKNRGSKEATDLKLELPFDGIYLLQPSGEAATTSSFKKNIPIGSLRPFNRIKISVWSKEAIRYSFTHDNYSTMEEETRITYPDGVALIRYPARISGAYSWFYWNSTWIGLVFFLCVLLVFITLLVLLEEKKSKKQREKEEDTGLEKEPGLKRKRIPQREFLD